jgi:hypothetical protein
MMYYSTIKHSFRNMAIIIICMMICGIMLPSCGAEAKKPTQKSDSKLDVVVETFVSLGDDIQEILSLLGANLNLQLVVSPKVKGTVNASFKNTSLRSILDAILAPLNAGYVEEDGVIKILTREEIDSNYRTVQYGNDPRRTGKVKLVKGEKPRLEIRDGDSVITIAKSVMLEEAMKALSAHYNVVEAPPREDWEVRLYLYPKEAEKLLPLLESQLPRGSRIEESLNLGTIGVFTSHEGQRSAGDFISGVESVIRHSEKRKSDSRTTQASSSTPQEHVLEILILQGTPKKKQYTTPTLLSNEAKIMGLEEEDLMFMGGWDWQTFGTGMVNLSGGKSQFDTYISGWTASGGADFRRRLLKQDSRVTLQLEIEKQMPMKQTVNAQGGGSVQQVTFTSKDKYKNVTMVRVETDIAPGRMTILASSSNDKYFEGPIVVAVRLRSKTTNASNTGTNNKRNR